jgi:outer membrane biosynthesis protein TonB
MAELTNKRANAAKGNRFWRALMLWTIFSLTNWSAVAQQSGVALPMVASAQVPLYPPLARVANVEGVVHVKVTTDGHRVVSTQVEDGNKLLAAAAEVNAKTWQFSLHEPVTFTVTYTYKLLTTEWKGNPNNPIVVLRFPTEVEVATLRWVEHNQ